MIDINELVTKNFQDNIEYLEKEHPKVFDKLAALDSAIENKHYTEKYELIYENSYFDVMEISTGKLLYGQDSREFARLVTKRIDYNPKVDTFECFQNFIISNNEKEKIKKENFNHYLSKYIDIIDYIQTNSQENQFLRKLNKFIFFGSGLGLHIQSVHQKITSETYLIVEDNLELFRLSLFVTNYKTIANDSKIIFSIFESNDEFSESSKKFLDNNYYDNSYIKYFTMLSHGTDKKKLFHAEVASQPHLTYSYNTMLTQSLKPLEYLMDKYKFLNKNLSFSNNGLNKYPFLLLAAGPSLQKNKEWLKNNHHKFIIVAISAVLPFLEKENISPDIIIHLEGASHAINLFDNIKSFNFIQHSLCFLSSRTPLNVINLFNKKQLFLFENATKYKKDSFKLISPCVGSLSYQLLLLLNIKNIYLLGLDLAVNQDGQTHIDGHMRTKKLSTSNDNTMKYEKDLIKIDGNTSRNTYTTLQYKSSIDAISYSCQLFKKDAQNIYNLSDGAMLAGTIPTQSKNIKINLDKKNILKLLYKICQESSLSGLTKQETIALKDKVNEAHRIKILILEIQAKNHLNEMQFLAILKDISSHISQNSMTLKYELYSILDNYLHYILPFIFKFFNTTNFSDIENHENIVYLKQKLCTSMVEIIDYDIENIEKFLKK